MRRFLILILIYFLITPCSSLALFEKKDYKAEFLKSAANAEKRKNYKSAFHIYEKTMFYYGTDKEVIESYAKFCERKLYLEKASELYKKLYALTKDSDHLYKSYLYEIKKNNIKTEKILKIKKDKRLTAAQQNRINIPLIEHYAKNLDWKNTKIYCDKVPKKNIPTFLVTSCIVADEKSPDAGKSYGYYLRYNKSYPDDVRIINKIISLAEKFNDFQMQETFTKRLIEINPNDNGIKYKLAGIYEKAGEFNKANKVYENLLATGDKSEHVIKSYAYSKSQTTKSKTVKGRTGLPTVKSTNGLPAVKKKPTTEDLLYSALRNRDFKTASRHIDSLLKTNPNTPKYIQLKIDISAALNDYKQAITYQEKLSTITSENGMQTPYEAKRLAFYYTQIKDFKKALEIIEKTMRLTPKDQELTDLALEYAMADENWDTALVYVNKKLKITPDSEKLIKIQGDLYSIQKDFPNAIISYEKLTQNYPNDEYKITLVNLYEANKDFASAQKIIEPLYLANPNDSKIVEMYLNNLIAQEKTQEAYLIVKKYNLDETPRGYRVFGDKALSDKQYRLAQTYFEKALPYDFQSEHATRQLAQSYRGQKKLNEAEQIYRTLLKENKDNTDAKIGLGYVEIDRKNYSEARGYFNQILNKNPKNDQARMGVTYSYLGNGDRLKALEELSKIRDTDEVVLTKSQTYYDMGMFSDSKNTLKGLVNKDADDLRYKIRRDNAITITPSYSFLIQTLAENFKLDYSRFGTNVAQNIDNNLTVFSEYNIYVYSSGQFGVAGENQLNNVVNEVKGGVYGRPKEKLEFRADFGAKIFQFGGGMLVTDSWIKHYFNDSFNLKFGVKRNNIEQSYLSAVGYPIDGRFTGRAADNRVYLEYDAKLPKQFYSFGRAVCGVVTAQNLETNPYTEALLGVGRVVYNNPENKAIQQVNMDISAYNTNYKYNLLEVYNSVGEIFGGYFSPSFFMGNTLNFKALGEIKKWHLKYGLTGFAGVQYSRDPNFTRLAYGYGPFLAYEPNDHITFNASYNFYNYADVQRHYFMVNAVIRGFNNARR